MYLSMFMDFSEFTRNLHLDLEAVRNARERERGRRKATTKTTEKNPQFFVKIMDYKNNRKKCSLNCVPAEVKLFGNWDSCSVT